LGYTTFKKTLLSSVIRQWLFLSAQWQFSEGESAMTRQRLVVALKRVYDEPETGDGTRVLVERLWPRGFSKKRAHVDLWLKEIAPSSELRRWYGHDPKKFAEFRRRYETELTSETGQAALAQLRELAKQGPVTLVFAAHDAEHANAVVLHDLLLREESTF